MTRTSTDRAARRRAGFTLAGIALALVAVLAVIAGLIVAHDLGSPRPNPATPASSTAPTSGTAPHVEPTSPPTDDTAAAEAALAQRPMLQLPVQAAQPQALTTQTTGSPITIPAPTQTVGRWIPGGFPDTPEGALGQLAALDETAINGGDPQVYATGYRQTSEPGAPAAATTGVYGVLAAMRARAGLAATGPVDGLSVTYQVDAAQIKGTAANGYAVVCVLGELSIGWQGQMIAAGMGDCQAMTWTGTQWQIAPGVLAALAPNAWPGSANAVAAGYRAVS